MMTSIRSLAREELNLQGRFSVVKDFFDYKYGLHSPSPQLSLRTQIHRLKNATAIYNIDVVMVGPTDTVANKRHFANAIHYTRDIFAPANNTIKRIGWHGVTYNYAGEDGKFSSDEASDLVKSVSKGQKNSVDVFVIEQFKSSTTEGTFPGSGCWGSRADGVVVDRVDSSNSTKNWTELGWTVAHEIGHFFGLNHRKNDNNVMFSHECEEPGNRGGVHLTAWQGGHLNDNIRRFKESGDADDIEEEEANCL